MFQFISYFAGMATRLQILIAGDSRVRNLVVSDPNDPDRYDATVVYRPSADIVALGKVIEEELKRKEYDILLVVGMHCDLTELRPTGAGGRGELCMALTNPDIEALYTYVTGYNYAWRSAYPKLSVFWALPHEADLEQYNEHRALNVLQRGEICNYCRHDASWSAQKLQSCVELVAQRLENDVAVVKLQTAFEEVLVRGGGDGLHVSAATNTELFERVLVGVIPQHPLPKAKFPGPVKTPEKRQHEHQRRRARLVRSRILKDAGVIEARAPLMAGRSSVVMKAPASRRNKVKNNRIARRQAAERDEAEHAAAVRACHAQRD